MPIYEYKCEKCKIIWEDYRDTIPKRIPQKKKCRKCGRMAIKELSMGTFHIKGTIHKWAKSDVTRMYNEMIDDSKERLKTQKSPYATYSMNADKAIASGEVKRLSDKEASAKAERERVLRKDAHNRKTRKAK